MSDTFRDETGVIRLRGEIDIAGVPLNAIPQGGPLTADLLTGVAGTSGFDVKGQDDPPAGTGATGSTLELRPAGSPNGGDTQWYAGDDSTQTKAGASISLVGGQVAGHGVARVRTNGVLGASGQALVSDGALGIVYGGVIIAAGVPAGAPVGMLPIAIDTTAVTGGIYGWNGAAWIKAATI